MRKSWTQAGIVSRIFASIVVFGVCVASRKAAGEPQVFSKASKCLGNYYRASAAGEESSQYDPPEKFTFVAGPGSLEVIHLNVIFNCCPDRLFSTILFPSSNHLQIREWEELTQGCFCLCPYELSTTVEGLSAGRYLVEVFAKEESEPRTSVWVEIPSGALESHVSECLGNETRALSALRTAPNSSAQKIDSAPWIEEVKFMGGGHIIEIFHHNATYNCCIQTIEVREDRPTSRTLRIIEREILEAPCDCICPYDISTSITALDPGLYWVELCRDTGGAEPERIAAEWVEVVDFRFAVGRCTGAAEMPAVPSSSSSSALEYLSGGASIGEISGAPVGDPGGKIFFEITSDTLTVRHEDARFNCCLESLALRLRIQDHVLILIESAILENGQGCRCMCAYDLEATISGIPPGWYPVEVILDEGGLPLAGEWIPVLQHSAGASLWILY